MSPRAKRLLLAGLVGAAAVSTALEAVVPDAHAADPNWAVSWFHFPGWNAVIGFAGCALIVVVSKFLGRVWLQKPEDYYRD